MKSDISALEDIKTLVNQFYTKVQRDELLGPVFSSRIENWQPHLEKIYTFWQTILLPGDPTYRGTPFAPHVNLPINGAHFERWLKLFHETVNENFSGPVAEEAKTRAGNIANVFNHKLAQMKSIS